MGNLLAGPARGERGCGEALGSQPSPAQGLPVPVAAAGRAALRHGEHPHATLAPVFCLCFQRKAQLVRQSPFVGFSPMRPLSSLPKLRLCVLRSDTNARGLCSIPWP